MTHTLDSICSDTFLISRIPRQEQKAVGKQNSYVGNITRLKYVAQNSPRRFPMLQKHHCIYSRVNTENNKEKMIEELSSFQRKKYNLIQ